MFSWTTRQRTRSAAWACALASAVALVTTGAGLAAPAAGSWTTSRPAVPQALNGTLAAESCTGPSACVAVGSYDGPAGPALTLAEAWNGTSWTRQPSPDPAGAHGSTLTAVSCPTAPACTAVGSALNAAGTAVPLIEAWNGTSWQIQATPNPAGSFGTHLTGVSCTSATACTAVGY